MVPMAPPLAPPECHCTCNWGAEARLHVQKCPKDVGCSLVPAAKGGNILWLQMAKASSGRAQVCGPSVVQPHGTPREVSTPQRPSTLALLTWAWGRAAWRGTPKAWIPQPSPREGWGVCETSSQHPSLPPPSLGPSLHPPSFRLLSSFHTSIHPSIPHSINPSVHLPSLPAPSLSLCCCRGVRDGSEMAPSQAGAFHYSKVINTTGL